MHAALHGQWLLQTARASLNWFRSILLVFTISPLCCPVRCISCQKVYVFVLCFVRAFHLVVITSSSSTSIYSALEWTWCVVLKQPRVYSSASLGSSVRLCTIWQTRQNERGRWIRQQARPPPTITPPWGWWTNFPSNNERCRLSSPEWVMDSPNVFCVELEEEVCSLYAAQDVTLSLWLCPHWRLLYPVVAQRRRCANEQVSGVAVL